MNTHADEISENKCQAVATSLPKLQRNVESPFQLEDKRLEAIAQRKLQEMINNSPRVQQLRAYQEIANNNPQVKQHRAYQAMADSFTSQAAQRTERLKEDTLPGKFKPIQKKENHPGLPDSLKSGIENLSDYSMGDVKIHYDLDKPVQLQAHAYAQEADIHLASGQEKYLPHEAWHVVQQKQGRVKPTMQMKEGVAVNDDKGLESEAETMGGKAFERTTTDFPDNTTAKLHETSAHYNIIQRAVNKLNELQENDPCVGLMNYSFKWQATEPHQNGYILQQVTRTEQVNPDTENVITTSCYWEAWKVTDSVIFNGEQDISDIQHDTWFNQEMAPGSDGSITMDCKVYFVTADQIAGMAPGTILAAGELLSSAEEPAVEKAHLFDHTYKYVWNRKLTGDNLLEVVRREMRIELEMSGQDGQTFEEMTATWDDGSWESFAESVNGNDPNNKQQLEEIKEIIHEIQSKSKRVVSAEPAIPLNQPTESASVTQLYSSTPQGKLSNTKEILLENDNHLFATQSKIDEANEIGGQISFTSGKSHDNRKELKEVIASVKNGTLAENLVEYNYQEDINKLRENALENLKNSTPLESEFEAIIEDLETMSQLSGVISKLVEAVLLVVNNVDPSFLKEMMERLVDETILPDNDSPMVDGKALSANKIAKALARSVLNEVNEIEGPLLEKRMKEYLELNTELKLRENRSLMPSDCRVMASCVAGFDAGTQGFDVTHQPVLAGDVYEYTSEHPKSEWNFHYAAVIMTDQTDHVTMENAAAKKSDKFSKTQYDYSWYFEMYGTKNEETFDYKYGPMLNPE